MTHYIETRTLLRQLHIPVKPNGGETPDFIHAIRHFQTREGLIPTGQWTPTLLKRLRRRVAAGDPATKS